MEEREGRKEGKRHRNILRKWKKTATMRNAIFFSYRDCFYTRYSVFVVIGNKGDLKECRRLVWEQETI